MTDKPEQLLDLFGAKHPHPLPDNVHPNGDGCEVMANNFLKKVIPRLFPTNS